MRVRTGHGSRIFVLASAAIAALLLGAAASASAGTLDQQQTSSDTDFALRTNQSAAQTFTAGISGGLDQVDLQLLRLGTPPALTVEIRDTSAGKPGTTVLAFASIATSGLGPSPGSFVPITFATPAPLAAGGQYAIVAYSPGSAGNEVGWRHGPGNPYPPGAGFFTLDPLPPGGNWTEFTESDFTFKTYVVHGAAPPGAATVPCKGQAATQVGTSGNDVITGTASRDVIAALGGNDTVSGLAGKDLICGGAGKDKLKGGGGKDVCKGGKGNDSGKCEVEKSL